MNTNDLKIFEAVATQGNFTKAAESMFTVQSNVTARIKSLEEEFGVELFTRTSRKVILTAAGDTLMRYSRQISHLLEEAKNDISSTDSLKGVVRVGCIETTMALKVPEIISQFGDLYPRVELEFKSAVLPVLINDVLNYRLDAAFVAAPINIPSLEQIVIREERLVVLVPSRIRKLTDVQAEGPLKIVVFEQGCFFRVKLESWLSSKGIIQYKTMVLNSIEGIVNFVEAGLGISLLPEEVINKYYSNRNINSFPVSKELGTMVTLLIYRNDLAPSRALRAFIDQYRNAVP